MLNKSAEIPSKIGIAKVVGLEERFLDDEGTLKEEVLGIAHDMGWSTRKSVTEKFEPFGLTHVLVLSESHIAVHTWPEFRTLRFNVELCAPYASFDGFPEVIQARMNPEFIRFEEFVEDPESGITRISKRHVLCRPTLVPVVSLP